LSGLGAVEPLGAGSKTKKKPFVVSERAKLGTPWDGGHKKKKRDRKGNSNPFNFPKLCLKPKKQKKLGGVKGHKKGKKNPQLGGFTRGGNTPVTKGTKNKKVGKGGGSWGDAQRYGLYR